MPKVIYGFLETLARSSKKFCLTWMEPYMVFDKVSKKGDPGGWIFYY